MAEGPRALVSSTDKLSPEALESSTLPFVADAPAAPMPFQGAGDEPAAWSRDATQPIDVSAAFPGGFPLPIPSPAPAPGRSLPAPTSAWAGGAPSLQAEPAPTIGDRLAAANRGAPAIEPPAPEPSAPAAREVLVPVWLDRKSVPRIVRKPAWQGLLDALEDEPLDPELDGSSLDAPREADERAQVFAILARGAPVGRRDLHGALARAEGKRGWGTPPVELVEGDLALPFDDIATLEALVATATPLAERDEPLASTLAAARSFLGSAGVRAAHATAQALSARLRDVLREGARGLPAGALDAKVVRALLEDRRYQRRRLLGGPHLRALLFLGGPEEPPVVCYLPEALSDDLPMAARFRARMIAEVHLAVDEDEPQPLALRAAAIARVAALPA